MFQQSHSSQAKYLHNYESVGILPQFNSHIDIKERNNQIMEKTIENKRSKIIVQQFCVHFQNCSISITTVFFSIFFVFLVLNQKKNQSGKKTSKKIWNLFNLQLSCLKSSFELLNNPNFTYLVLTKLVLSYMSQINITMLTPYVYLV